MHLVRRALAAAAVLWMLALPAAVYAATHWANRWAARAFALAVYAVGGLVCHQLPERSFHLWAAQLPVCARCTGLYLGAALAAAVAVRFEARAGEASASGPSAGADARDAGRLALAAAVSPTALTLAYEWSTGSAPANAIRAAAGFLLGAVAAWLVVREAPHERTPSRLRSSRAHGRIG